MTWLCMSYVHKTSDVTDTIDRLSQCRSVVSSQAKLCEISSNEHEFFVTVHGPPTDPASKPSSNYTYQIQDHVLHKQLQPLQILRVGERKNLRWFICNTRLTLQPFQNHCVEQPRRQGTVDSRPVPTQVG
jgi:hypothetical protein